MKNFIKRGHVLNYTNGTGAAILAGMVIIIGALVGIPVTDIGAGEVGAVNLKGVYEVPKAAGAITIGAKLYWDATNKNITTTATNNTYAGIAYLGAAAGETTVQLLLANGI
jgi:predicted RecA/RadA family phage recombinase